LDIKKRTGCPRGTKKWGQEKKKRGEEKFPIGSRGAEGGENAPHRREKAKQDEVQKRHGPAKGTQGKKKKKKRA